ncbi:hypothetical protein CHS0354_042785 [Potamilus streckersoni]|uniref:Uncharacterized protein n=1 Tax=Potamilus streckersoni TaxID=2493646 RepID=A0AAE0W6Y7_9BIVA|nr:hypothetical protein CHS0354_042785 [Potamilus streckersoni]
MFGRFRKIRRRHQSVKLSKLAELLLALKKAPCRSTHETDVPMRFTFANLPQRIWKWTYDNPPKQKRDKVL